MDEESNVCRPYGQRDHRHNLISIPNGDSSNLRERLQEGKGKRRRTRVKRSTTRLRQRPSRKRSRSKMLSIFFRTHRNRRMCSRVRKLPRAWDSRLACGYMGERHGTHLTVNLPVNIEPDHVDDQRHKGGHPRDRVQLHQTKEIAGRQHDPQKRRLPVHTHIVHR
jgi:hypothetical protein